MKGLVEVMAMAMAVAAVLRLVLVLEVPAEVLFLMCPSCCPCSAVRDSQHCLWMASRRAEAAAALEHASALPLLP